MTTKLVVGALFVTTCLLGTTACGLLSIPSTADIKAVTAQAGNIATIEQTTLLADSFIQFDPAIDVTQSAEWNAIAIGATISANAATCADVVVAVNNTTMSATFGDGGTSCQLSNGAADAGSSAPEGLIVTSGTVDLTVSTLDAGIGVSIDLEGVQTTSGPLNGNVSFSTADSENYFVTGSVSGDAGTPIALELSISSDSTSFTTNGTANTEGGPTINFNNVNKRSADCYPNSGSITIADPDILVTITYDETTASTGVATGTAQITAKVLGNATEADEAETFALPAYGNCGG